MKDDIDIHPLIFQDERIAKALERIADTLDDYMDLTLVGQALVHNVESMAPEYRETFKPLTDKLQEIADRRAKRG